MNSNYSTKCMLGHIFLLLCANIQMSKPLDYEEFLDLTLQTLCPYADFCTFGQSTTFSVKNKVPCCTPCSCDSGCLVFGNCCPDFPLVLKSATPIEPTAICTAAIHFSYDAFELKTDRYQGFDFHYITSSCPSGYSNKDEIERCLQPNTLDFKDRVMVSDERGHAFTNRFCAQCNNARVVTTWNLRLICMTYPEQLADLYDYQTLNKHSCVIVSSPPSKDIDLKTRCEPIKYNKCNITGKWETFNKFTQRACESTIFPYIKPSFISRPIYRNPYCYICNEGSGYNMKHECSPGSNSGRDETKFSPFSALIDWTMGVQNNNGAMVDVNRCPVTHVLDHHFDKCRQLNCPINHFPRYGTCVRAFKAMNALGIYMGINVMYEDEATARFFNEFDPTNLGHLPNNMETVVDAILTSIGLKGPSCATCPSRLLRKTDQRSSVFILGVKTRDTKCTGRRVIATLKKTRANRMIPKLVIGGVHLNFSIQMDYGFRLYQGFPGYEGLSLIPGDQTCPLQVYLMPGFYCANVDLSSADYHKLSLNGNTPEQWDITEVDNRNALESNREKIYKICVDTYLGKRERGADTSPCVRTDFVVQFMSLIAVALVRFWMSCGF